jgi:PKD repeat protein
VISNPDVTGAGCGFQKRAVILTASSKGSLPTFIQSFFKDPIIATGNCEFQNIKFAIQNSQEISSVEWNFGDPLSGIQNVSNELAPTHIFSSEGIYTVRLVYLLNGGCFPDTVYKKVYAGPFKLFLGNDTTLCQGDSLQTKFTIPGASYLWNDNSTGPALTIKQPGKYWTTASLNNYCWAADTIVVSFRNPPSFTLGNDTAICLNSSITLSPKTSFSNHTYSWNTQSSSTQITVINAGTYSLSITDDLGCVSIDSIQLSIKTLSNFSLGADTTLCQSTLQLKDVAIKSTIHRYRQL